MNRTALQFRLRVMLALSLSLITASTASAQQQARTIRERPTQGPADLAHFIPKDDLILLVEFDGLDAHATAWKNSAVYKILTQTKTGALVDDIALQLFDRLLANVPQVPDKPTSSQALAALKYVLHKGFAFGVYGKLPGIPSGVIVARGLESAEGKATAGFLRKLMETSPEKTQEVRKGRKLTVVSGGAWWTEKDDLVVAFPPIENADLVLDTIDAKHDSAGKLPVRSELTKSVDGFTPVLRAFFDMKAIPGLPPQAEALGLGDLQRVELRWGFQDDAIVTNLRMVAPSPRRGLLAFLDGPTFTAETLPPIPAGTKDFLALSLDAESMFMKFAELSTFMNPQGGAQVKMMQDSFQNATGLRLREDVLHHLGPKFSLFSKVTGNSVELGPGLSWVAPEFTLVAESDDTSALGKALDALMGLMLQRIKAAPDAAKAPKIQPAAAPEKGYDITPPPNSDGPFGASLKPALRVGKTLFSAGSSPAAASRGLTLEAKNARWTPPAEYSAMTKRLPKDMVLLAVSDPRETLPQAIASLPAIIESLNAPMVHQQQLRGARPTGPFLKIDKGKLPTAKELSDRLSPGSFSLSIDKQGWSLTMRDSFPSVTSPTTSGIAVALLLPAVQSAREAAKRSQCVNNLKQIGLALHNYHAANNHFPGDVKDKDGKLLLSWRVQILPYLEQQDLYNKFKLDEPWDSENNKPLIEQMPRLFACPTSKNQKAGTTHYRGFTGKGGFFEDGDGITIASITDGTSNTLAVGEFKESVIWTKPDKADTDDPSTFLASDHPNGFNMLFGDGSVRFIKDTVAKALLKALVSRSGGEVINIDF